MANFGGFQKTKNLILKKTFSVEKKYFKVAFRVGQSLIHEKNRNMFGREMRTKQKRKKRNNEQTKKKLMKTCKQ